VQQRNATRAAKKAALASLVKTPSATAPAKATS
jgi:hypothetical protein